MGETSDSESRPARIAAVSTYVLFGVILALGLWYGDARSQEFESLFYKVLWIVIIGVPIFVGYMWPSVSARAATLVALPTVTLTALRLFLDPEATLAVVGIVFALIYGLIAWTAAMIGAGLKRSRGKA